MSDESAGMAALREALTRLRRQSPALAGSSKASRSARCAAAPISRAFPSCASRLSPRCSAPRRPSAASRRRSRAASSACSLRPDRSSSRRITARMLGRGGGARRRRPHRRRNRRQLLLLPPHPRRLHHGERRACARLRRDPGRARQYRTDVAGDRPSQARRPIAGRRIFSRSCSTRRARPASTSPRSARRWFPARRCPRACAPNWSGAASRRGRPTPPPNSA